jgi:hypothetical protein
MATWQDAEKEITRLEQAIAAIRADEERQVDVFDRAEATGRDTFVVNGRTLTLAQLQSEIAKVRENANARIAPFQNNISALEQQIADVRDAQRTLDEARQVANNPATGPFAVSAAQAKADVRAAESNFQRLSKKRVTIPKAPAAPSARRPGGVETAAQARAEVARQPRGAARQPAATEPAATQPTTPATTPTTPTRRRRGTGAGPTGTVVVDGERVRVGGDRWKEIIQEEFGSLWDVYSNNADVRKVIDRAVSEGWYNDPTKLTESLRNTNWFRTTESKARQFAIRQSTDPATLNDEIAQNAQSIRDTAANTGVVLSDTTINRLASDKVKYGWTDTELSNAVGSEVVATARAGGAQGMAELTRATYGSTLREVADSYAVKPTDSLIEQWTAQILSGQKTQKEYEDLMREQARTLYRSLTPQIDKGLDVKTAVSAYTNQAQRVLGVDETQIDWTDNKWNRALNYQDPKTGEYRQMDTWEWNRYLRSMPEWQDTDDAKQLYRSAAFTLAQAFGRTT